MCIYVYVYVCVYPGVVAHHISSSSSIPNSKREKNVMTVAAPPTGGSAFCGALEHGMGEVLVSVENLSEDTINLRNIF